MNMRNTLIDAGIGWLAGAGISLAMGFIVFPAIITNVIHFSGSTADWIVLGIVLIPVSIASLAGGLVGGRMAIEGGRGGQLLMAAIVGALLAAPVSRLGFWYSAW